MRRRQSNEIGHSHLSFYVENLDQAVASDEAKGITGAGLRVDGGMVVQ